MKRAIQSLSTRRKWYAAGGIAAVGALLVLGARQRVPDSESEDPGPPEQPGQIGVIALLEEMIDLERLAKLADPPFVAHMASSYDRRSVSAADSEGWYANDDWVSDTRPNYVALEEDWGQREYVLLDAKGPGAIVRIWSATPTGTLRIYLDGDESPVLEEPLLELLSGSGSIPAPFAHVVAAGYNLYFPFPFRKSCKVTVDDIVATDPFRGGPLQKFYYQINYRQYPPQVAPRVRTFHRAQLPRARQVMQRVAQVLEQPWTAYQPSTSRKVVPLESSPTGAELVLEQSGGGVIRELVLDVGDLREASLRGSSLTMRFDDELTVETPLGDFFATGPGLAAYESLPFSVAVDGRLVSRWPMPFRERATIAVRGSVAVEGEASVEPLPWSEASLYFHAKWRPTQTAPTRPPSDLCLLGIEGRGNYVGNVFNIKNPQGAKWWGEGDEKIYVDGEPFPSFFGTGTEDYYGYAWSTSQTFAQAFHAQTRTARSHFSGRFSVNRFHVIDAVPFSSALRFDMELWHWDDTKVAWDAVTYYYARPGAKDDARPLEASDLKLR